MQGGGDRDYSQRDNPLRSWLTARKDDIVDDSTPKPKQPDVSTATSPSWADESVDESDTNTSYDASPSPLPNQRATAPRRELSSTEKANDEVEDVYLLPPSGRDSREPSRQQRTNGMNGGSRDDVEDVYRLPPSGRDSREPSRQRRVNGASGGAANMPRGTKARTHGKNQRGGKQNTSAGGKVGVSDPGNGKRGKGDSSTYAKVVTRNGWSTVPKKRKFDSVSPKSAYPLRGIPTTVNRHVYVQGLRVIDGLGEDDMIDSVRMFCIERNITPVFVRIIPVKFDDTRTGCKLTIREDDYDRVMSEYFWPEDVTVRDWTPRNKDNNDAGGDAN